MGPSPDLFASMAACPGHHFPHLGFPRCVSAPSFIGLQGMHHLADAEEKARKKRQSRSPSRDGRSPGGRSPSRSGGSRGSSRSSSLGGLAQSGTSQVLRNLPPPGFSCNFGPGSFDTRSRTTYVWNEYMSYAAHEQRGPGSGHIMGPASPAKMSGDISDIDKESHMHARALAGVWTNEGEDAFSHGFRKPREWHGMQKGMLGEYHRNVSSKSLA